MRRRSLVAPKPSDTMATRYPPAINVFTLRFMFAPAATVSNAQAARAIANAIPLDSEVFEQRQMQVCQGCFFWITNMSSAFKRAGAASRQHERDAPRIVGVALTDAGSVHQCGMVQQSTVAVGSRAHPVQQVGKLCDVICVDLFNFCDFFGLPGVVRNRMMR